MGGVSASQQTDQELWKANLERTVDSPDSLPAISKGNNSQHEQTTGNDRYVLRRL